MPIVDEQHTVANKHFVFDSDAGTNERVAGNFAALADVRVALNLDERADSRRVADAASVEIYERSKLHSITQHHVGRGPYIRW
jgi:hypothetical protein